MQTIGIDRLKELVKPKKEPATPKLDLKAGIPVRIRVKEVVMGENTIRRKTRQLQAAVVSLVIDEMDGNPLAEGTVEFKTDLQGLISQMIPHLESAAGKTFLLGYTTDSKGKKIWQFEHLPDEQNSLIL